MKKLTFILVACLLFSCTDEKKKSNEQLREIILILKKDMDHRQLELQNTLAMNPNQKSVVSPLGFDSTYAAYTSEINRVDTMLYKIEARLKAYWESKDDLKDIEEQVESVCSSKNITIILDRGPHELSKNYHENYNFFMRDIRNKRKSDGLYLRVKFLMLSIEIYELMEESFLSMNLTKHILYLKESYGKQDQE